MKTGVIEFILSGVGSKSEKMQPFLKEVQRVRESLADDASSAATKQVFEVPWTRDVGWSGVRLTF